MPEKLDKFISPYTVPPGGMYFYTIPETGSKFTSPTPTGLLDMIRAHYRANNLPVPENIDALIADHICKRVPKGFCEGEPESKFLSVGDIREGTRLLIQKARLGSPGFLVTQAEAERRAAICSACPLNLHGVCTSCTSGLKNLARMLIANKTTSRDDLLDTCAECGCMLKAKVHVSIEGLAVTQKHAYPSNCWLHGTICDTSKKEEGA